MNLGNNTSTYAGTGTQNRQETFTTTIAARILKVLQNGNYFIEGSREVLINGEKQDNKNTPWILVTAILLGVCICYVSYSLWGENAAWISFFIILFGGIYILGLLASILLYPFLKHGNSSTKWSFDEIPEIKRFMNQSLPHTH